MVLSGPDWIVTLRDYRILMDNTSTCASKSGKHRSGIWTALFERDNLNNLGGEIPNALFGTVFSVLAHQRNAIIFHITFFDTRFKQLKDR